MSVDPVRLSRSVSSSVKLDVGDILPGELGKQVGTGICCN